MDSIKSFKGYGKVDATEDREFKRKTRRRLIIICVSAVILLLIIIGAIIGVLARKSDGGGGSSPTASPSSSSSPSTSIRAVCSVTRYPLSCSSSLARTINGTDVTDPEELFKLSLKVAIDELNRVHSIPDSVAAAATDPMVRAALDVCKELFVDAIDSLNGSVSSMVSGPLTGSKITDLRTWISAALTDQATCLDGLDNTTGDARAKMEAAMVNSTQFTSNSLAIATKILDILEKLNIPLHRRRRLLSEEEEDVVVALKNQRRLLLWLETAKPNVTVAKDGTGMFKTIQEAVDVAPVKGKNPFVIYVKEGVYTEYVIVYKNRTNVVLMGDGMYKTIIDGSKNFIDGVPTFATATFIADGKMFMAKDMGFKNSAGPLKHQAVAARVKSDRSVFLRCYFDGYQDTLYAHTGNQFYRDCDVTGTIDFIFGDAPTVFQNCKIRPRQPLVNQQNTVTAQGRIDENENTGISIQGCTFSPFGNVTAPTYLGRPWKKYSTTVVMKSEIGGVVHPAGWYSWDGITTPPDTIYYAEYKNTGPGSHVAGRVKWAGYKPAISDEEAARFAVEQFIHGGDWLPDTGVMFQSGL
ncbi:Pectinesterase 1 [Acorus gramineus]|uniref:Pectinesterase n=1 Tax=Acorus gramineus TaxID=55184 RepID=A0AAV9BVV5_ACOGR|nr:Pectinesterase 1 [Acorus gramineus]